MSSAAAAISNSETVEHSNIEKFRQIKLLAHDFERRDVNAKDALYAALAALFDFVTELETEAYRREFVEAQAGKWGKVARDNPFQPFVKLAFSGEGISETSRSQYAAVLRYAEFARDKTLSLGDWLRASGGIDGLYKDAANFFPKPHKHVQQAKLDAAVQAVKAQRLSEQFDLGRGDAPEGFVHALLHVDNTGKAHIVQYTERDQAKLEDLFQKLAKVEAKKAVEAEKPLFALCRAIRLLTTIVPAGKSNIDRLITLSRKANEYGGSAVMVQAISTAYEGALGEILLGDMIDWVPIDGILAFGQSEAARFCEAFAISGSWKFDGSVLVHDEATVADIDLLDSLPAVPKGKFYFQRRADFRQIAPFIVEFDGAVGFLGQCRRNAKGKAYRGVLTLDWTGQHLRYQPYAAGGASHDIFGLSIDPKFGDDRLFGCDMLVGLCDVADEIQSDLTGWLVSTPEEDNCAMLIDHMAGKDRINIVMPLVKTANGHTTQTNVALPIPSKV
ncbi:hypothetical protein BSY18_3392 [Blastomonas sp. RAC04]|uniref:hypothetical protein n=1 Tax=Blastomonas sp. RAC04 TaxID=1842535 RepID=UPI000856ADA8|nr:hypothetical protein [Blastomonas sp. RAC04]AOG00139.1 hypothetical protein BSY18_3392 [Blastomonas sp. RAC04]